MPLSYMRKNTRSIIWEPVNQLPIMFNCYDIKLNIITKGLEMTAAVTGYRQHRCRFQLKMS